MASLRPLDDRVVLKVLDAEEKTAGGILLPDSAQEKPQRGKVTAVGEGKLGRDGKRLKLDVKKGDIVQTDYCMGEIVNVLDAGTPSERYVVKSSDVKVRGEARDGEKLVPSGQGDGCAVALPPEELDTHAVRRRRAHLRAHLDVHVHVHAHARAHAHAHAHAHARTHTHTHPCSCTHPPSCTCPCRPPLFPAPCVCMSLYELCARA